MLCWETARSASLQGWTTISASRYGWKNFRQYWNVGDWLKIKPNKEIYHELRAYRTERSAACSTQKCNRLSRRDGNVRLFCAWRGTAQNRHGGSAHRSRC